MLWGFIDSDYSLKQEAHLTLQKIEIIKPQLLAGVLLFGAPGEIRTPDQVVRSHLLYPAELRVLEVSTKCNLY